MYALLPIEEMAAQVVLHVMLEILVIGVGIVSVILFEPSYASKWTSSLL